MSSNIKLPFKRKQPKEDAFQNVALICLRWFKKKNSTTF